MNSPTGTTPRQAAYRELCAILAQLSGRSRRARRTLLEAELARALERAHDFQVRCAQLNVVVAAQKDKLLAADIEVALARGEARRDLQAVRREVFAVVERCRSFERICSDLLATICAATAVEPPPLVEPPRPGAPVDEVDEEAITERCPKSGATPDRGQP